MHSQNASQAPASLSSSTYRDCVLLGLILSASALIRLWLIFNSGQLLDTDGPEYFYNSSLVYEHLSMLDLREAAKEYVYAHWGCILFGTIPFFIKPAFLTQEETSAIFFALPTLFNIFLIYKIALGFELGSRKALLAGLLYALSFSNIYHIKDVLPHDLSIMFFLTAVLVVVSSKQKYLSLFFVGVLCFICFFTYYGYWTLALVCLIFATIYRTISVRHFIKKSAITASGFFVPFGLFLLIGYYYGADYIGHFVSFSKTITNGDFKEGYSLPFFFLLYAEGPLFLLWMAACLLAWRNFHHEAARYFWAGAAAIYLILAIGSNILEMFVVYGRLVRGIVPMLCLTATIVISEWDRKIIALILVTLTAWFLYHCVQLKYIMQHGEINASYQSAVAHNQDDNREIILKPVCKPQLDLCGMPADESCRILASFLVPENYPFFQYDGMNPRHRPLTRTYKLYYEIRDCPKTTP